MSVTTTVETTLPYFPRPEFADRCLRYLGLHKGMALYAPRRRGKTQFLLNELGPGAENQGYTVVYTDLWKRKNDPGLAIVDALEQAAGIRGSLKLSKVKGTAKLKGGVAEIGGETEFEKSSSATDLEGRLETALRKVVAKGRPVLLAIDEFQTLAEAGDVFIASLRANVQEHPALKLFLTGSSRRGMARLLNRSDSAFYRMAIPEDLPPLGRTFVEDRAQVYLDRSGRSQIDIEALAAVYERVHCVPEHLNQIIVHMVVLGLNDPWVGFEVWRQKLASSEEASQWEELEPLDRLVLQLVSAGQQRLFAKDRLTWYGQVLGRKVTPNAVSVATRRLVTKQILGQSETHGEYEIADEAIALYLSEAPLKLPALPSAAK